MWALEQLSHVRVKEFTCGALENETRQQLQRFTLVISSSEQHPAVLSALSLSLLHRVFIVYSQSE